MKKNQPIAVQQVEQTTAQESTHELLTFKTSYTMQADIFNMGSMKKIAGVINTVQEKIPDFEEIPSKIKRYEKIPIIELRKLVKLARELKPGDPQKEQFSENDFTKLLTYYKREGFHTNFVFDVTSKRLSICALSYLSQNKKGIPDEVINIFAEALDSPDEDTQKNAAYGLCYASLNRKGRIIGSEIAEKLDNILKKLMRDSALEKIKLKILILAVLAKEEIKIFDNDRLNFLIQFITFVENPSSIYPLNNRKPTAYAESDRWLHHPGLAHQTERAQAHQLLDKKDLENILKHWRLAGDHDDNLLISRALKALVENNQTGFPDKSRVIKIIEEGLMDNDRDIVMNFNIAAGLWLKKTGAKTTLDTRNLSASLSNATMDLKKHALSAITYYIDNEPNYFSSKKQKESLETILEELKKEYPHSEVFHHANFILSKINETINNLEHSLLHKDWCVAITQRIIHDIKLHQQITEKILNGLGTIIAEGDGKYYDQMARINAIQILTEVAVQGHKSIPDETLRVIWWTIFSDKNLEMVNGALAVVGFYAKNRVIDFFLKPEYLKKLGDLLLKNETKEYAAGAIRYILSKLKFKCYEPIFAELFQCICYVFKNAEQNQKDLKDHAISALYYGACLKFDFDSKSEAYQKIEFRYPLMNTVESLALHFRTPMSETLILQCLAVINTILSHQQAIEIPENALVEIIYLLRFDHEKMRENVLYIVKNYIERNCAENQNLPKCLDRINELLQIQNIHSHESAVKVLSFFMQKKVKIPLITIEALSALLTIRKSELPITIVAMLNHLSHNNHFSQAVISNLLFILPDNTEQIIALTLSTIRIACQNPSINKIEIFEDQCRILAEHVSNTYARHENRYNALLILKTLSDKRSKLSVEVISTISTVLYSYQKNMHHVFLQLFYKQADFYVSSIVQKKGAFSQCLQEIESMVNVPGMQSDVLDILCKVTKFSYSLRDKNESSRKVALYKYEINGNTQSTLVNILYESLEDEIRSKAIIVLRNCEESFLSDEAKMTKSLDREFQLVLSVNLESMHFETLITLIKKSKQITLENILQVEKLVLIKKIFSHLGFIDLLKVLVELQQNLTKISVEKIVENFTIEAKHARALGEIIVEIMKNETYIPSDIFSKYESLLVSEKKFPACIEAIEIVAKQKHPVRISTIQKILELIQNKDKEVKNAAAKTLYYLAKNQENIKVPIKQLIACIKTSSNEHYQKYLRLTIAVLSKEGHEDEKSFSELVNDNSDEDFSNICFHQLDKQLDGKITKPFLETLNLIKKYIDGIKENTDSINLLEALSKLDLPPLGLHFTNAVQNILQKAKSQENRSRVLNCIKALDNKIVLHPDFLEDIAGYTYDEMLCKNACAILHKNLNALSQTAIEILLDTMRGNIKDRESIIHLLKTLPAQLKEDLNGEISCVISTEAFYLEVSSGDESYQKVSAFCEFAFRDVVALRHLDALFSAIENSKNVNNLAIFMKKILMGKDKIPGAFYTFILQKVIAFRYSTSFILPRNEQLFSPQEKVNDDIDDICIYLFRSFYINVQDFKPYITQLQNRVCENISLKLLRLLEPLIERDLDLLTPKCLNAIINTLNNEKAEITLREECAAILVLYTAHINDIHLVIKRGRELWSQTKVKKLYPYIIQLFEIIRFRNENIFKAADFVNSTINMFANYFSSGTDFPTASELLPALRSYAEKRNQYEDFSLRFLKNPNLEKYFLLFTFLARKNIDLDCLHAKNDRALQNELICYDLILNTESNIYLSDESTLNINSFLEAFNNLREVFSEKSTEFLSLLCLKQRRENLTLPQVTEVLTMLSFMPEDQLKNFLLPFIDFKFNWLSLRISNLILEKQIQSNDYQLIYQAMAKLNWDVPLLNNFLSVLDKKNTIDELLEFIEFSKSHPIVRDHLKDFFKKNTNKKQKTTLKMMKDKIIYVIITNELRSIINKVCYAEDYHSATEKSKLIYDYYIKRFGFLIQHGYFEKIYSLLEAMHQNHSYIHLASLQGIFQCLDICYTYQLPESVLIVDDIVFCYDKTSKKLYEIALKKIFQNDNADQKDLISEFAQMNQKVSSAYLDDINTIFTQVTKKRSEYSKLNHDDIRHWSEKNNTSLNIQDNNVLANVISIIDRAFAIHLRHSLHDTQIISLIILIRLNGKTSGRLIQKSTGEGKSDVIAAFATICTLLSDPQSKHVDVITSNDFLAKRDAKIYKHFYSAFHIHVASNQDDDDYSTGLKPCYADKVQVVYGDIGQFQFDYLREYYYLLGTRGKRTFSTVIIDEVDNMLLDEGAKIAMLSQVMPNMECLETILFSLWFNLQSVLSCIQKLGDEFYFIKNDSQENSKSTTPSESTLIKIDSVFDFLYEKLYEYFDILLDATRKNDYVHLPAHLVAFAKSQQRIWIINAIEAHFLYQNEIDYVIRSDARGIKIIVPVDFDNTGVLKSGTTWGDGLHQFLQIKHGLRITPENLVTNFISNAAYIKKYDVNAKGNIFGLTGTLGSEQSCKLLIEYYKLDMLKMPTYKKKQFYDKIPGSIENTESSWIFSIICSTEREIQNGRVILILCETMVKAKSIKAAMPKNVKTNLYIENDRDDFLRCPQDAGTVIIATNLAGRGIDIKLTIEVIKKGGLHVCFTFLPRNLRVEEQGFGRAGRNGQPGTGELILLKDETLEKLSLILNRDLNQNNLTINDVKRYRNEAEELQLAEFKKNELPYTDLKDELFNEFRKLLLRLKVEDDKNKESFYDNLKKNIMQWSGHCESEPLNDNEKLHQDFHDEYIKSKHESVEELWGLWLKKILKENAVLTPTKKLEIMQKFNDFAIKVIEDYTTNKVIYNATYHIRYGNRLFKRANDMSYFNRIISSRTLLYQGAIAAYNEAIKIDPDTAYPAYYNQAYALIKIKAKDHKETVRKKFENLAQQMKNNVLAQLGRIMMMYQYLPKNAVHYNDFYSQHQYMMHFFKELYDSVTSIIDTIDRSNKLVHIELNKPHNIAKFHHLIQRHIDEVMRDKIKENDHVNVSFHDWVHHVDLAQQDQSDDILQIKEIGEKNIPIGIHFQQDRMSHVDDKKTVLKALLPINKEVSFVNRFLSKESKDSIELPLDVSIQEKNVEKTLLFLEHSLCKHDHIELTISNISYELVERFEHEFEREKMQAYIVTSNDDNSEFEYLITYHEKHNKNSNNTHKKNYKIIFEKLTTQTAIDIMKAVNSYTYIADFSKNDEAISDNVLQMLFHIKLCRMTQNAANKLIEQTDFEVDISFVALNQKMASYLNSKVTAKYNKDAVYEFSALPYDLALKILTEKRAPPADLDVKMYSFNKFLPNFHYSKMILDIYLNNGFIGLYDVRELPPLQWRTVVALSTLATLEMAAGIACAFTVVGAPLTIGLIFESISDGTQILDIIKNHEFSRSSYAIQKVLSLSILSVTSALAIAKTLKAVRAAKALHTSSVLVNSVDDASIAAVHATNAAIQGHHISLESAKYTFKQLAGEGIKRSITFAAEKTLNQAGKMALDHMKPVYHQLISDEFSKIFKNNMIISQLEKILIADTYRDIIIERHLLEMEIIKAIDTTYKSSVNAFSVSVDNFDAFHRQFKNVLEDKNNQIHSDSTRLMAEIFCESLGDAIDLGKAMVIVRLLKSDINPVIVDNIFINIFAFLKTPELYPEDKTIDESKVNLHPYNNIRNQVLQVCLNLHALADERCYRARNYLLQVAVDHMLEKTCITLAAMGAKVMQAASTAVNQLGTAASNAFISRVNPSSINANTTSEAITDSAPVSSYFETKTHASQKHHRKSGMQDRHTQQKQESGMKNELKRYSKMAETHALNSLKKRKIEDHKHHFAKSLQHTIQRFERAKTDASLNHMTKSGILRIAKESKGKNYVHEIKTIMTNSQHHFAHASHKVSKKLLSSKMSLENEVGQSALLALQQNIMVQHELLLQKDLEKRELLLKEAMQEMNDKMAPLLAFLLVEQKKKIIFILSMLLIEADYMIEIESMEHDDVGEEVATSHKREVRKTMTQIELQNKVNVLFGEGDSDTIHERLMEYTKEIAITFESVQHLIELLEENLVEYHQLKLGEQNMKGNKALGKLVTQDNLKLAMSHLEKKDFTQYDRLLESGKLGEPGYLALSLVKGFLDLRSQSIKTDLERQKLCANALKAAMEANVKFTQQLTEIETGRQELLKGIMDSYKEKITECCKSADKIYEMYKNEKSEALKSKLLDSADKTKQLAETFMDKCTEAAKANGIDSDTIKVCMNISKEILTATLSTIKSLGEQSSKNETTFIDAATTVMVAIVNRSNNASNTSAAQQSTSSASSAVSSTGMMINAAPTVLNNNQVTASGVIREDKGITLSQISGQFVVDIVYADFKEENRLAISNQCKKYLDDAVSFKESPATGKITKICFETQQVAEKLFSTLTQNNALALRK